MPRPHVAIAVTSHATAVSFLPGLAGHLAAAGWRVTVLCAPGPGLAALTGAGVQVREVPMARDPAPGDLRSLHLLFRAFRELRPDVVLAATPKAGLLATLAARTCRVPVVVHLAWGLRSETLTGPSRLLVRGLETLSARAAHRVLANSGSLGRELVRLRMIAAGRLDVLGAGSSHGVDVERFTPGPPGDPELDDALAALGGGPVVGFVGRITPDKGVPELVDAMRLLRVRGVTARLLLAGPAEDPGTAERVRRARDDEGLPILLLGGRADPLPIYRVLDVHCLPTWREGFPNVCLEAAGCGLPTVTTDATGAVDSVVPGRTGLVVPVGDACALAAALERLLTAPVERSRLGRAARERAVAEFAAPLVHRAHEGYLRALLRAANTPRDGDESSVVPPVALDRVPGPSQRREAS
ncbi:glycosyltransferase [Pseudonocardia sp. C8]|uniref:glycosyltransferase n=1 Tax=Pseudonocardia sp. C8 TaxID=2762759 RepID=UPI0016429DF0|nr:glycosyltransferase [Pseudonocardia sp. C8]MBC3193498.1 glycosyltransferase [Pseudonocardia sp. C8]